MKRIILWIFISLSAYGPGGCMPEVLAGADPDLTNVQLGFASTKENYPGYLDKIPVKRKCNEIELFKECSEISHLRGRDYIVFRWHDEATLCAVGKRQNEKCTWVSQFDHIMIRKGCLISWCEK